jgi:outer membrane protein assembly factor BamB
VLAACGSGADVRKPAALQVVANPASLTVAWTAKIPNVEFPLQVSAMADTFTLAASDGTVLAVQAATGRELWRVAVGAPIAAGVGTDGANAAVVTRDNELLVVNGGKVAWRQRLNGRVLTSPLVAGERVFVVGVDRTVQAFDVLDGRRLWTQQRPSDALTLTQAGVIVPYRNSLLVGQGARLTALDPTSGAVSWDVPVASPRGANEVERLADLVAPAARVGDTICARSFQAGVGCVFADRGSLAWSKPIGGNDGVAADAEFVFGADTADRITAWRTASGESAWTSEKLLYRNLTAPVLTGQGVAFGDSQGLIHFMDRSSGALTARLSTDGSPVAGTPVVLGGLMLVVTRSGTLTAFNVR